MLEAVNSVLSNASYTKAIADQQSVATSYAANPARVQQASLQAPYISLYIKVDVNFDKALLQIRDRDTGDVVRQIPSETQLEAYRRAQEVVAPRVTYDETETTDTSVPQTTSAPDTKEVSVPAVTSAPVQAAPAPTFTAVTTPAPQVSSVNTSA